jgi:hypothetical protein
MADSKPRELPISSVRITDRFWSGYQELIRNSVIFFQWEALNDRVPGAQLSHACFRAACLAAQRSLCQTVWVRER